MVKELMGRAVALVMLIFGTLMMILIMPLSMIALMHWFDFHWWSAAIVTFVAAPFMPFLAIGGAFLWYQAGFDFQKAAKPYSDIAPSVSKSATEEDLSLMRAAVFPKLKKDCMGSFSKHEQWTELVITTADKFCYCYATNALKAVTKDELEYQAKNKDPSPAYHKLMQKVSIMCNVE